MGDGLVRMKQADRAVTVRGLAEREVTADLATWTIAYSAKAGDLQSAQAKADADTKSIRAFFGALGFDGDAVQPTGANVSQYNDQGVTTYTVKQRMSLAHHRHQKGAKPRSSGSSIWSNKASSWKKGRAWPLPTPN